MSENDEKAVSAYRFTRRESHLLVTAELALSGFF